MWLELIGNRRTQPNIRICAAPANYLDRPAWTIPRGTHPDAGTTSHRRALQLKASDLITTRPHPAPRACMLMTGRRLAARSSGEQSGPASQPTNRAKRSPSRSPQCPGPGRKSLAGHSRGATAETSARRSKPRARPPGPRGSPRLTRATQTALMDWLLSLLLSREAVAFSIAIAAASLFIVAWHLWGRDD